MATGFMTRHFILLFALACAFIGARAAAADIALIGVIGDKAAVLAIDGGEPKTVKVGQSWRGITVLAVEKDQASVEVEGKKRVLQRGVHYRNVEATASALRRVLLAADTRGHFYIEGAVNRVPVRFLVDTGATLVSLPVAEAQRLGINYLQGTPGYSQLADGRRVVSYRVILESVMVGDITLYNVDGVVQGGGEPLLGMSFLSRTEMRNDGQRMVLTKRY